MGALVTVLLMSTAIGQSDAEQSRLLVERLRTERVEERREVARKIVELGAAALPELEKATKDKDSEVAGQVRDLIHSIRESVATTAALPGEGPFHLFVSRSGRFVVVCGPRSLLVFEADTLKPVKTLDWVVRSVGFSADDQEMSVVGECLVRVGTKDWNETFRERLPNAEVQTSGQALITTDGGVYYRTANGGLSYATLASGRLRTEEVGKRTEVENPEVSGILGRCGDWLLLTLAPGERAAVCNRKRAYLLRSHETEALSAGMISDRVVFVCASQITAYDPVTWKPAGAWKRESKAVAAAFDVGAQRIFMSDGSRLRVFSLSEPEKERVYDQVKVLPSDFVIDTNARLLYVISGDREIKLHCWHLRN